MVTETVIQDPEKVQNINLSITEFGGGGRGKPYCTGFHSLESTDGTDDKKKELIVCIVL